MIGFLVFIDLLTGVHKKAETGINICLTYDEAHTWLLEYLDNSGAQVISASIYDKNTNDLVYALKSGAESTANGRPIIRTKSGSFIVSTTTRRVYTEIPI